MVVGCSFCLFDYTHNSPPSNHNLVAVTQLKVTIVDVINVNSNIKNKKWYFLQMIMF